MDLLAAVGWRERGLKQRAGMCGGGWRRVGNAPSLGAYNKGVRPNINPYPNINILLHESLPYGIIIVIITIIIIIIINNNTIIIIIHVQGPARLQTRAKANVPGRSSERRSVLKFRSARSVGRRYTYIYICI